MDDNQEIFESNNKSIAKLVPTKSDTEIAAELKKEFIDAWQPLLQMMEKAHRMNFRVIVNAGMNELGHAFIHNMEIQRIYK
jgi:hypothetical protein